MPTQEVDLYEEFEGIFKSKQISYYFKIKEYVESRYHELKNMTDEEIETIVNKYENFDVDIDVDIEYEDVEYYIENCSKRNLEKLKGVINININDDRKYYSDRLDKVVERYTSENNIFDLNDFVDNYLKKEFY